MLQHFSVLLTDVKSIVYYFTKGLIRAVCLLPVLYLLGCSERDLPEHLQELCALEVHQEAQQEAQQVNCSYDTSFGPLKIYSNHPEMPVETPLQLTAVLPQRDELNSLRIVASEITGISMYMGRIPVQWREIAANTWHADILLGACTDPNMIWQLTLTLADSSDTSNRISIQIPFQSTW
ncbi:MAG: hypothetical protein LAT53_01530 [Idiomarina sp.]|nr:hypothetical protein [Idiomarina sp.]